MRYLGIDYGDRHVGIAIGDDETRVALPLDTITYHAEDELISAIKKSVASEAIDVLVVGIPMLSSRSTTQIEKTEAFVAALQSAVAIPVKTQDESFTSKQAARHIHEGGRSTKDDHSVAAMLILQSYLDSLLSQ